MAMKPSTFLSRSTMALACAGLVVSVPALVLPISAAEAQFGGLLGRSPPSDTNTTQPQADSCEAQTRSGSGGIGRSILRGALGAATSQVGRIGSVARFVPSLSVADALTNAIACRLDEPEQLKAKDATLEATRSETVGTSVAWTSDTRADVTGRSTIVALEDQPAARGRGRGGGVGGGRCMLVDDVILINGEETVAQKRMCRVPPETRYALSA